MVPLAPVRSASYPVPVRRLTGSFHASFSVRLTTNALRFPSVPATRFREDFHLQVIAHAGPTTKERARPFGRTLPVPQGDFYGKYLLLHGYRRKEGYHRQCHAVGIHSEGNDVITRSGTRQWGSRLPLPQLPGSRPCSRSTSQANSRLAAIILHLLQRCLLQPCSIRRTDEHECFKTQRHRGPGALYLVNSQWRWHRPFFLVQP